ncbi:hypothetical protein ZIOFF_018593 [Zingiber officinale]|uniref:TRF2/HOY1 PH-like domain-containing protein n=1 Tax=Zingiber officinale TaxID=94328 RepID=A0A8J5LB28_ZINOF|nr:hypothetical protein ZIOFF_018593 [Zingiber officinale]
MPAPPAALTPTACSRSRSHRPLPPSAHAPRHCLVVDPTPPSLTTAPRLAPIMLCLEGGLKSKVEFNWSNFTAIKAIFFEGGHGTLDIVLARPPLFFRATDPQPRKHTLWQATRDFTNGQEYIHRYEGDLVAKCYFAKRKLVWEVLEGGLRSKVEFNWSNFTAIKAVFFEGGHGTLDIVLARPPLFFRATDPQPRKHALWQATRDFTNGQEYIHSLSTNKVEELASGNTSLPCDALFDKEITDFIAQFFDNDSQSSAQAGVGSDDEPYSTLEAEVSFLEFLIVPCCDKS